MKDKKGIAGIQPINIKRSFIISILIHLAILLILSITVSQFDMPKEIKPINIAFETDMSSMATGIEENLNNPTANTAPKMNERTTETASTPNIPDRIDTTGENPAASSSSSATDIKESIQKVPTSDNSSDLQQESASESPIDDVEENLDEYFDELFEEDVSSQQQNEELAEIDENIDDILNEAAENGSPSDTDSTGTPSAGDPLSDADWSATPRATVFFPDLEDKIPEEYRQIGIGYSVEVQISFDKNGLATKVEILESSGDSTIDSIFKTELRKIRVEAISANRTDTITKTFTISME